MSTLTLALWLLLFQASVVIQITEPGPVVQVAPVEINLALTTFLKVNCSFAADSASEVVTLISPTVSRSKDSGKTFTEVASITEFPPTTVNMATSENIRADGLVNEAESSPVIKVNPDEVNIGLTESLEVNCSFAVDSVPNLAALISLLVSHSNDSGQTFTEMVSITEFRPTTVNLLTTESIQATGVVDQAGESYLHLKWDHPTVRQGGLYQCSAKGMDLVGHDVLMTTTAQVMVDEPYLGDFAVKIQEMENYTKTLEETVSHLQTHTKNLEEKITEMENYTATLDQTILDINDHIKSLEQTEQNIHIFESFLEIPIINSTSKYYICKDGFYNVQISMDMCRGIGGYLLEINTAGEFQAIQAYLNTTTGFTNVLIAGSDADSEGTWVLPSTGQSPYFSWYPGRPTTITTRNCLYLYYGYQWRMFDDVCNWGSLYSNIRYICEVPQT